MRVFVEVNNAVGFIDACAKVSRVLAWSNRQEVLVMTASKPNDNKGSFGIRKVSAIGKYAVQLLLLLLLLLLSFIIIG
jgi:hypothetical protein